MEISRDPAPRTGEYSQRSQQLTKQLPARWHATFLTRRPSLFAIPKASTLAHAEENAGAGDLQLSDTDFALIGAVFPLGLSRAPCRSCEGAAGHVSGRHWRPLRHSRVSAAEGPAVPAG
jgi:hypothetical protein